MTDATKPTLADVIARGIPEGVSELGTSGNFQVKVSGKYIGTWPSQNLAEIANAVWRERGTDYFPAASAAA